MMSSVIAVIPARGGSRGVARKNLADLGGVPLLGHMIRAALGADLAMDLIVSTEDEEIAGVAREYGAEVPFIRPLDLAGDHVESLPVVSHAVSHMEVARGKTYDLVVLLQATSPLCRPSDIRACVEKLATRGDAESCVAVTAAGSHPFKMKRLLDGDRVINYVDQGFEDMRPRQLLPKVYRRAGSVYVSRRAVIFEKHSLVGEPCLGVVVPPETAVDIDSALDLEFVRFLYSRRARGDRQ